LVGCGGVLLVTIVAVAAGVGFFMARNYLDPSRNPIDHLAEMLIGAPVAMLTVRIVTGGPKLLFGLITANAILWTVSPTLRTVAGSLAISGIALALPNADWSLGSRDRRRE
jgi:hypothetical protein